MKKSLLVLVLAASLLASTSAGAATPRKASALIRASYNTIRGKITDESTQKPISETVVYSVKSQVQAVSNTKGLYRLIVPKTDTFQVLKIMKKGYQTRYASFPVFGNTTYDIVLTPTTTPVEPEVSISFEGPTSSTLPVNSKDAQFLNLSITSNKDVEVRKLNLTISSTATTGNAGGLINTESTPNANYTDIKLVDRDTGEILMGPESLNVTGSDTTQTLTFDTPWQIENDEARRISFTMDIANNSKLASDQIWVTLEPVSTVDGILDIATGQYVTDITPESQIRGNTMTIGAPSLSVSLASTPVSDTYVKGTKNVDVLGLMLTAGNADEITVTGLTMAGYIDEDADGDYSAGSENSIYLKNTINSVTIYDDAGNKLADSKNVGTDGTAVFSNMTFKISAGGSKKIVLTVDQIATTAPQGSTNDAFGFDLTSVTAVNSNGNSVTVTPGYPNGGGTVISPTNDPRVAITVAFAGSLTIANADNMMGDKTVVAGTDGLLTARFKATAANEDFMIKKLNFEVANLTRGATTAVEYVYIIYPDKNGTLKTSIKSPLIDGTNGVKLANFNNLDMYVPKDDTTITFEVYIDTNTVVSGATNSGDRIRITFDATDATDEFEAIGQSSGTTIVDSVTSMDADISNGNSIALYKSIPTFLTNTAKSGCPTNSTKPMNGTNNIYCFDVTAYTSGSVDIYKVSLQVSATGFTTVGTLSLYDYADQSTILATTAISNNIATFTMTTPDTVGAGGTVTYMVKGSLTIDSSAQNVVIASRVLDDTSFALNTAAASVSGNVVWSDRSASSHSPTTSDWTNGYKLSGLPTDQVTMSL